MRITFIKALAALNILTDHPPKNTREWTS